MNHRLAKQLKKAGFPQKDEPSGVVSSPAKEMLGDLLVTVTKTEKVYLPTLEELISECGGDAKMLLDMGGGSWAYAIDGKGEGGKTPREAVAKLYIALNK